MADLSQFDPNIAGNPNLNIFGLPFTEEDAKLVILPIPWEVTVSYGSGTSRAPEQLLSASLHVDLFDWDSPEAWKKGFHMREIDKKLLMKSDYLRKEAELYIDYISEGEDVNANQFMCKTLKDVNQGSEFLNQWVFEQTTELMKKGKLVGILGGDHSVSLGFIKALAEEHKEFAVLQIDAHCDLREAYMGFNYSHASVTRNIINEVPEVLRVVQVGIRDYSELEWNYIFNSNYKVIAYFDRELKDRTYDGQSWREIAEEIVEKLPDKVYISFDVDGLDPKLCPNTGMPVPGGLEMEQTFYLFKKIIQSGRKIIGFDLCETGVDENEWDANVSARILFKLCNLLVTSAS